MGVLSDLFGKKPKIPNLPKISPGDVQAEAIAENTRNIAGAEALVAGATEVNARQISKALEMAVPGALQQIRQNILAQTRGELSKNETDAILRNAAATGFDLGVMGGARTLGGNLALRNLGIGTLERQQQGQENYQALAQPYLGASVPVESTWYSTQQRLDFAEKERNAMFQRDLLKAQVSAAPNPAVRGIFDTAMSLIGMALSAYSGGPGYNSSSVAGGGGGGMSTPRWDQGYEDVGGGWRASFGSSGRFGFGRTAGGIGYIGRQPGPG